MSEQGRLDGRRAVLLTMSKERFGTPMTPTLAYLLDSVNDPARLKQICRHEAAPVFHPRPEVRVSLDERPHSASPCKLPLGMGARACVVELGSRPTERRPSYRRLRSRAVRGERRSRPVTW